MKSKNRKRMEALERQEKYEALSRKQKIRKLNQGGYTAEKERTRNGFPPLTPLKGE